MARELDPEYHKKYKKRYRSIPENAKKESEQHKVWYLANKKHRKQYLVSNKTKVKEAHKTYIREREQRDPNFKLANRLRARLYKITKGLVKAGSSVKDLGCSLSELKSYLEQRFQKGMTWDNYGKWHIDHCNPLSKFDLTDRQQFLEACHYTNLQPLWATENIIKGTKYVKTSIY